MIRPACKLGEPCAHGTGSSSPTFPENIVATPDVTALQRSDLNQFLFADIGTEANGTTLSVLSVFARRGADPWTEAAASRHSHEPTPPTVSRP